MIAYMDYLRPLPNGGAARRTFRGISYATVPDRAAWLRTPLVHELLTALPESVRTPFVEAFLADEPGDTGEIARYFAAHSAVCRHALGRPGAGLAMDILCSGPAESPIDRYLIDCPVGRQLRQRVNAIEERLPLWMKAAGDGLPVLSVDNIGSGASRSTMLAMVRRRRFHPEADVRCIDPDPASLGTARKIARAFGLEKNVSFVEGGLETARPRGAAMVLLLWTLPRLSGEGGRRLLRRLRAFCRPGGLVVFGTVLSQALLDDPLADFIMHIHGWRIRYTTVEDSLRLAESVGMTVFGWCFDEPSRHHCIVAARNPE